MNLPRFYFILFLVGAFALGLNIYSVAVHGYLRPPLGAFVPNDTFMDFYNTNYFSYHEMRYDGWRSVYTPLVFIFGALLTEQRCAGLLPLMLRTCDYLQIAPLIVANLLFCAYVGWNLGKKCSPNPVVRLCIFAGLFLSMPNLFALERGNYIIIAALALAVHTFSKNIIVKALCAGLMVNFKQYLGLLVATMLIERNAKGFFMAGLATIWIFACSIIVLGDPNWYLLFENMFYFAGTSEISIVEKLWFPTSVHSWARVVASEKFIQKYEPAAVWLSVLFILIKSGAILFYFQIIKSALNKKHNGNAEILALGTILFLLAVTDTIGGYGIILLFPFLNAFSKNNQVDLPILITLLVLLIPIDLQIGPQRFVNEVSYLAGYTIDKQIGITLLSYLKPFAIFILLFKTAKISHANEEKSY